MKKLTIFGVIVTFVAVFIMWVVSVINTEVRLRNSGLAQQEVCTAFFDKMWKVINQEAQVSNQYKEAFKEIYIPLIEGRYSKGDGSLMKWITEHNPTFDTRLYEKLMISIEAQREGFFMEQKKLVDIDREHKTFRQTIPNKFLIGNKSDLNITIITSETTDKVYETGQENDINLF